MCDQLEHEADAKRLLDIEAITDASFIHFRTGARTRAVLALNDDINHKFAEHYAHVAVKLYNGDGRSAGSQAYQRYHQSHFKEVAALRHPNVQQSLAGGVVSGIGPYGILQYVPGDELAPLLEQRRFSVNDAESIFSQILFNIWIPIWSAGLRFKDCPAGNFVLTPVGTVVMIDTEQMRKDVVELLDQPAIWTQRDKHEASGLKRLAGLLTRIVMSAQADVREATVKRHIKEAMAKSCLLEKLKVLGRDTVATEAPADQAKQAVRKTIELIKLQGYLE